VTALLFIASRDCINGVVFGIVAQGQPVHFNRLVTSPCTIGPAQNGIRAAFFLVEAKSFFDTLIASSYLFRADTIQQDHSHILGRMGRRILFEIRGGLFPLSHFSVRQSKVIVNLRIS